MESQDTENKLIELKIDGESNETIDKIIDVIKKLSTWIDPDILIENDGIGSYEYWGQKCYDKGVDYAICEGNRGHNYILSVDVTDVIETEDYGIDNIIEDIITGCYEEISKTVGGDDFDEGSGKSWSTPELNIWFKPTIIKKEENNKIFLVIECEWTEKESQQPPTKSRWLEIRI